MAASSQPAAAHRPDGVEHDLVDDGGVAGLDRRLDRDRQGARIGRRLDFDAGRLSRARLRAAGPFGSRDSARLDGRDRRGDRRLERPEGAGELLLATPLRYPLPELGHERLEVAPPGAGLGQLERAPRRVAGVGQAAVRLLRVGQEVEHAGGLGRTTRPRRGPRPGRPGWSRPAARGGARSRRRPGASSIRSELEERPTHAGVGQRPVRRQGGRLGIGGDGRLVAAPDRGDVPDPEGALVALVERFFAHRPPRLSARNPFWTWSRFSAWSRTMLRGPSRTSEVISSPRWAGRQCITRVDGPADERSRASTW